MKKIIQCIVYSCFFAASAALAGDGAPNILWEERYEMSNKYFMTEYIIHTNDNGFLVTGSTGAGASQRGFVKTGSDGKQQWSKVLGNDSLSVYITLCYSLPNADLAFIGSTGRQRSTVKGPEQPFFMQSDVQKGITLNSFTNESADERLLGTPQVIRETDGSFLFIGKKDYTPEETIFFRRVGADMKKISEKEVSLSRFFDNTTATKDISLGYVTKAHDGGYISFCSRRTTTNFFGAVFIKLDSKGEIEFGKIFESEPGMPNYIRPKYAIATSDGGYVLLHTSDMIGVPNQTKYTSVVTKLNATGDVLWTSEIDKGNLTNIDTRYLVETKAGEILVAGSYRKLNQKSETVAGTEDNLLIKFNATGEQLWEKQWGEPNIDERLEYVLEENDGYLLAGAVGREFIRDLWLAKVVLSTTGIAEDINPTTGFNISPNPAVTSVNLGYEVSAAAIVTIKIIDALGNIIATPLSGFKSEGSYLLPFSTVGISTGIYSAQITIDGKIMSKNFIVFK